MTKSNRVVRLKRRPAGQVAADDFAILDEPLAEPKDGEIRVRIAYVSLDPAMRGWISEGRSYVEPVAVGDVMRAYAAGHVELSRNPRFAVGDAVWALARPGIDRRRVQRRRKRKTCLECVDAVDLPPGGQRVVPGDGQTMTHIER